MCWIKINPMTDMATILVFENLLLLLVYKYIHNLGMALIRLILRLGWLCCPLAKVDVRAETQGSAVTPVLASEV